MIPFTRECWDNIGEELALDCVRHEAIEAGADPDTLTMRYEDRPERMDPEFGVLPAERIVFVEGWEAPT